MSQMEDRAGKDASPEAQAEAQKILKEMARQALDESPVYMEHIYQTFHDCTEQLHAGNDREGLDAFARGASDLGEMLQLLEHIDAVAAPSQPVATAAFRLGIISCVKGLEESMLQQDLVALSDHIEGKLLNLLPMWDEVAQEMDAGLTAHGC